MPASLIAAAVLLTLFVPGYLFQAGVREFTNVLTAERDVYAVAQAVAISAGFLIFTFSVLELLSSTASWVSFEGLEGRLDDVHDDLLHDPASKTGKGLTAAQVIGLVVLLVGTNLAGKGFGKIMSRRRKARLNADRGDAGAQVDGPWAARTFHGALNPFFSTSDLDQHIDKVIIAAKAPGAPPTYVRLVRQGQEDVIGLVDTYAAEASASPLGSGLAVSTRWTYDPEGGWRARGGAHIAKPGIIKILWWNEQQGARPTWLEVVAS
jgi:hypothetical protein